MSQMRAVCLPLEKLDKCSTCDERANLQLCSKCGETIYCSKRCQENDWPHHRLTCNRVERVELEVMYPFLAGLAEIVIREYRSHLNGVPILLGKRIPEDEFTLEKWCPGLSTDSARRKLFQRILHENYTLPILMSISVALLVGIYTTKTVRLMYRGSPISDFGIAKGSLNVQDKNRHIYFKKTPLHCLVLPGQDPNDHYWLYFKTVGNKEVIVDLATSMFNLGSQVKVDPYIPGEFPNDSFAPALLQEGVAENVTGPHRERARFSVLRNNDLHAIASHATGYRVTWFEADDMWDFMDTVAGSECRGIEKIIATDLLQSALAQFESIVEERAWQQWPKTPECRPCSDDAESSEWWRELRKWKKRNKSYVPQDRISSTSRLHDMIITSIIIAHMLQGLEISD